VLRSAANCAFSSTLNTSSALDRLIAKYPFVQASDLSNHEALPRRLYHPLGFFIRTIDFENALNLDQQPVDQPKVAANDTKVSAVELAR
jgi:hypothetical protein